MRVIKTSSYTKIAQWASPDEFTPSLKHSGRKKGYEDGISGCPPTCNDPEYMDGYKEGKESKISQVQSVERGTSIPVSLAKTNIFRLV